MPKKKPPGASEPKVVLSPAEAAKAVGDWQQRIKRAQRDAEAKRQTLELLAKHFPECLSQFGGERLDRLFVEHLPNHKPGELFGKTWPMVLVAVEKLLERTEMAIDPGQSADSAREDAEWDQSLIAQQNYVFQSTMRLFLLAWRLWPDLRQRIDETSHQYREHLVKRGPEPDFSVIGEINKRFREQVRFRAPKHDADWRGLWRFLAMGNLPQKWDGEAVGEIEDTIRGLWVRSRSDGISGKRTPKGDKRKAAAKRKNKADEGEQGTTGEGDKRTTLTHSATDEPPEKYRKDGHPIGPVTATKTAMGFALYQKQVGHSATQYRNNCDTKLESGTIWARESVASPGKIEFFFPSHTLKNNVEKWLREYKPRNSTQPNATRRK